MRRLGRLRLRAALRLEKRLLGFALIAILAALPVAAQTAPEVRVGMEPQQITLGDPVVIELGVTPPAGSQAPVFPDWSLMTWGQAEILEIGEVLQSPAGPGLNQYTQRLMITAFEVGEIELPPVSIEIPRATGDSQFAHSDTRVLSVVSVLPEGQPSEADLVPRPPAGLRALPTGNLFWWVVALLAIVGALLTAYLLRMPTEEKVVVPKLDPLDEFDQLVRQLGGEADPIAFHTRLSFALRRFLGRTLGFGAVESTTTQIQTRLRQHQLSGETIRHASQLLRDCDQVKFARILAGRQESGETLGEAGRLAREVYRDIRPEEGEGSTEGASS